MQLSVAYKISTSHVKESIGWQEGKRKDHVVATKMISV